MAGFSHLTQDGELTMVDVGGKEQSQRVAVARAEISLSPATLALLSAKALPKGDVLAVAKIAGILAAKKTADLIPLCHQVQLSRVDVRFDVDRENNRIVIESEVRCADRTGVEMEALTAVQVAALAIFDMCKAVQKDMVIGNCRLVYKAGGRGGVYLAPGWLRGSRRPSARPHMRWSKRLSLKSQT